MPSLSIGKYISTTSASTIRDLDGDNPSGQFGGSISWSGFSSGVEFLTFNGKDGQLYNGGTYNGGVSIKIPTPAELHGLTGSSKVFWDFNIYDSLDRLYLRIMEW